MSTEVDSGLLYVATGKEYIAEANWSVASAKRHGLQAALFCDDPGAASSHFDYVHTIESPEHGFIDKIGPLRQSPFERTLFLDTDTFVRSDLRDLFSLLDRFDLAYANAPIRRHIGVLLDGVPPSFVQPNTGVLLYRRGKKMNAFVDAWLCIYRRHLRELSPPPNDQPSFKQAVYESDLRVYVLPSEYNLRLDKPALVGGNTAAHILHARPAIVQRALHKFENLPQPAPTLFVKDEDDLVRHFGARSLVRVVLRHARRWLSRFLQSFGKESS